MTKVILFLQKAVFSVGLLASLLFMQTAAASAQNVTQDIQNGLCAGANLQLDDPAAKSGSCQTDKSGITKINQIIHHIVNLLSAIVGVIAVIMIIVGGLRYVTSGGSDASVTGAKNTILYAVIGLIIVAFSQILVHFVLNNLTNT